MTYNQLLNYGKKLAKKHKVEIEGIRLLVLELSNLNGALFLASIDEECPKDIEEKILDAFDKYFSGLPVQHIIGYSYFYGYKMIVNKDVLIPRPETEELIGYVLAYYDEMFENQVVDLVDVGTGSGNIAIALAKEEANMKVVATDISNEALNTAKQNAINNEANVSFYQGNMLDPLIEKNMKFDILVSNPPYIPDDEYVEPLVLDNEPNIALFGGDKGMKFYNEIFEKAHLVLKEKAIMAFEHSHKTKQEMLALASKYFPDAKSFVIQDLNGKDRFLIVLIGKEND
ncbi:MAG: peptide chain release factor N(5)-glutamine methyltransferase [Bacilli bacterium]|nr:peptide chain release factor N(5)-glutamine methyltransferase [Bacilli bacterium]